MDRVSMDLDAHCEAEDGEPTCKSMRGRREEGKKRGGGGGRGWGGVAGGALQRFDGEVLRSWHHRSKARQVS